MRVWQVIASEFIGQSSDEFLYKVQEASAGPPWNVDDPWIVRIIGFFSYIRDINCFPNWRPRTVIRGYPRGSAVVPLDFTNMISY